jgi:short-subunit dehydrogenase
MTNLKEKYGEWALITGASSGIGREFARYLSKEKINLVLIARRYEKLLELKDELTTKYKIEILPVQSDLTKDESIAKINEIVGQINVGILINNAGAGYVGKFSEMDLKKGAGLVKLNCLAPVMLTHHFIKKMIQNRKGAIIFLGSIVGLQPSPYLAVYSATKSFNIFFAEALWYELKKFNIDVLSVSPGSTATDFERVSKDTSKFITSKPEEVVASAFKSLGKKPAIIHRTINKILIGLSNLLPIKISLTLAGKIAYRRNLKGR